MALAQPKRIKWIDITEIGPAMAQVTWINTDERNPDDEQTVLAAWSGPSCIEGMQTMIYHASDAPDSRACWRDVHGEELDPPTHWAVVEMPK